MKGKTKDGIRECFNGKGERTGFQAIVRETDHTGKRFSASKKFPNRGQAKTWREQTIRKIREGEFETDSLVKNATVEEMMDYWLHKGPASKHGDGGDRAKCAHANLVAYMGRSTLAALDAELILDYVKWRFEKHKVSQATIRKELMWASQAYTLYAHVKAIKKDNPFLVAKEILRINKYLPPDTKRKTRPTHEQFEKLINRPNKHYPLMPLLIEFAALEGMRRGEIALMTRDWYKNNRLEIPKEHTKTSTARTIILFPRSIEILDSLPFQMDGTFWGMSRGAITKQFNKTCRALKIKGLTFHDLRHEACSRMGDMQMPILDIAAKSGHKNLNMLQLYVQLSPNEEAKQYAIERAGLASPSLLKRFGITV